MVSNSVKTQSVSTLISVLIREQMLTFFPYLMNLAPFPGHFSTKIIVLPFSLTIIFYLTVLAPSSGILFETMFDVLFSLIGAPCFSSLLFSPVRGKKVLGGLDLLVNISHCMKSIVVLNVFRERVIEHI